MAQQQAKAPGTDLALRVAAENGFSETQLELIRNTAAKGCTAEEVAQLLIMARRTGLDPLAKQIYMIKRWDNQTKREIATPQTGIDGYRLTADRTERYAPGKEPSYAYDGDGGLLSATAYVKKLAGGAWHEVAATAFWSEYVQTKKDGQPTATWQKMPHVMLAKCAEALALRRAFPAELSGVYTAEEMAQADSEPVVTVEAPPASPAPSSGWNVPCDDCGNGIESWGNWTPRAIAEKSLDAYERVLCWDCAKKEKARRQAAKEDATEAEYREAEKSPEPPAPRRQMSAFQKQKIEDLYREMYPDTDLTKGVDSLFQGLTGYGPSNATSDDGRQILAHLLREKRNRPQSKPAAVS